MSHTTSQSEPVLSTLNSDGTRRKIRPKLSVGPFFIKRKYVAYVLLLIFTVTPYLSLNGKPLILLDLPARRFVLFGTTFLPSDTVLLMLLLVTIVLGVFFVTALLGRVWCGWACPQTVYMEFVFRPIERLFEGSPAQQMKLDREGLSGKRILKNIVFVLVALFIAHTFLAYFVGVENLVKWVRRSPFEHPVSFLVMAGVTTAMFLDFAWFREQTCIVACPYGRLQSVLLDRQSLIVGYDVNRGEPRGKARDTSQGDCIDCFACVHTCPTGIDIRKGLQMECIGCAQCIDACDAIMDRVKKPRGLIRYSSQDGFEGKARSLLRPRVLIYPMILVVTTSLFLVALNRTERAEVTVLRGLGKPFTLLETGEVSNQLRVKIMNRADETHAFQLRLIDANDMKLIAPMNPVTVSSNHSETITLFIVGNKELFVPRGKRLVRLHLSASAMRFEKTVSYELLGPTEKHEVTP